MQKSVFISFPLEDLKKEIQEAVSEILEEYSKKQNEDDCFLTRNETAKLLKISLPTLHSWTKKGILKGYRLNSRVRYKKVEIEASLNGKYGRR